MKNLSKILTVLSALTLAFGLTACSSKSKKTDEDSLAQQSIQEPVVDESLQPMNNDNDLGASSTGLGH